MTETHDDTRLQLGRVDGRLSALENRIDRHETYVVKELGAINDKLDRALLAQAQGAGAFRAVHWIVSALASVAAWVLGHVTGSSASGH